MKTYRQFQIVPLLSLLALLAVILQSCAGPGDDKSNTFQKQQTGHGSQIGINKQAVFKGKIYFTLNRDLYVMDGQRNLTQLTQGMDVRDPAVSPDGKWIAFAAFHPNYTDLMLMPTGGGNARTLRSGQGEFVDNPPYAPKSTHFWYFQPSWKSDSKTLLFLSDFAKTYVNPGVDAFLLDLQVFSVSIDNPTAQPKTVAIAVYGDGGNRDASYRPGHPDQIMYTRYQYDPKTRTQQLVQIMLEDANAITNHPYQYQPGIPGDPAVALTPATPDLVNIQPVFSPDGNSIAYVRREDASHMGLYIMQVPEDADKFVQDPNNTQFATAALLPYQDQKKNVRILQQQFISQPVWSADGTQLAYLTYTNGVFDIWLVNVKVDPKTKVYTLSGSPLQLTDAAQKRLDADSRPAWTL